MVRMLMLLTVLLGCFAAVTLSAPVEQLVPASINAYPAQQLLILSPQAQLQLKPALKLQTPLIQPLTSIGRIQNANDQTIIFYPATNLPLTSNKQLKQTELLDQFIQIIQSWGPGQTPGGGSNDEGSSCRTDISSTTSSQDNNNKADEESAKIELNPEAETIPQGGQTPASTVPLPPNNRRFYTIGAAPQFFGNFDFLQNPVHPIFSLQPLEPIKSRSVSEIRNELTTTLLKSKQNPATLSPITSPQIVADNSGYQPGVTAQRFAQFLVEQKVLHPENSIQNQERPGVAAQEFVQLLSPGQSLVHSSSKQELHSDGGEGDENKDSIPVRLDEEASIAQAKPVAIAITGKGGLAQSAPVGTAIVGEDGFALSSPSATAIAGDFPPDKVGEIVDGKLKKQ